MSQTTERQTFRALVADVAARAKEKLPQAVNGRVESAARLVINGDVEPLDDGSIKVGGSDPTRWYHLVGSACTCTDFTSGKAPESWCKHRIAAGIDKRVRELLPQSTAVETAPQAPGPQEPLYESPASVNVHLESSGRRIQLTLRDHDETRLLARLEEVLQRYPQPQAPAQPPRRGEGWCAKHQVPMTQTTKDGRSWWSHKTTDGQWCKGR
jgi:hypothetical protein